MPVSPALKRVRKEAQSLRPAWIQPTFHALKSFRVAVFIAEEVRPTLIWEANEF
jgi:hypothetical protein